jgi:hypothetical protein
MGSTYTDNGGIEKIGLGEQAGAWGTTTNNNFDIIDRLINGVGTIDLSSSGASHTLTTSDGSLSDGMFKVLVLSGATEACTITIGPNNADKLYFVKNSSGQSVTFSQGSGANVTILNGFGAIIFADGAGSGAAVTDLTALFTTSQAIDGVVIGGTTPAAGSFTTVTANGGVTVDNINIDGTEIDLSSGDLTVDVAGNIDLDADGGTIKISDGGTELLNITNSSSDVIIKPVVDGKDVIFQQRDGTEVARIEDNGTFNVVTDKLAINGTAVTSTAAELNLLDGGTSIGSSITVADADGIVVNDSGTMKTIPASDIKTYTTAGATSGTVTSVATGNGLTGGTITGSGTVSMANSWMTNSATLHDTGTTGTYTNSTGYPVFISGRSTSNGQRTFTVTINGVGKTLDMVDGDSGTYDDLATVLPNGASIAVDSGTFVYMAVQMRPG